MKRSIKSRLARTKVRLVHYYEYGVRGVWSDTRHTLPVKIIKTLNLSVRAFFNSDIQTKACAMTYRTILAIVPALALVFAIGRGFGLQDMLENELLSALPSQKVLLDHTFEYVNSYLDNSSRGLFMGAGIVLLLWTLVSILGSVEHAFNDIWGVKNGRSFWRKVTDYMAICLILPILMICASGITVFVSTAVQRALPYEFITPLLTIMLDVASLMLIWLFFTGVYMLMPNTKVKFKNAFIAGIFAGTAFIILQWLFITGQIYVSKYNAIYGSIAFVPLFLIWVQFTWVICLTGGVICYASQNIFNYNFNDEIKHISRSFRMKILVTIMAITVKRFLKSGEATTQSDMIDSYGLPARLVTQSVNFLIEAGLLMRVVKDPKKEEFAFAPGVDAANLTIGEVIERTRNAGATDFIPGYRRRFASIIRELDRCEASMLDTASQIKLKDLKIEEVPIAERPGIKPSRHVFRRKRSKATTKAK